MEVDKMLNPIFGKLKDIELNIWQKQFQIWEMPKPLHCFSHCPLNKYTIMVKDNTDYARVLEELKHIYKQKYGVVLDRELLYVIVRINELQVAVNKKMDTITKVSFQSGKDYFYYSLGKYLAFIIFGIGLTLLSCYFFIAREEKAPEVLPGH